MAVERSAAAPDRDAKRRMDDLARRIHRLHRRILEVDILRGALPLRARMAARRATRPQVELRERKWRERSPAYGAALDASEMLAPTTRIVGIDGLQWSVPLTRPDDPAHVERSLGHQHFPYRAIAQTRELAVGGTMIDLGANIGRMSIPRVILGDVTAAFCVEADPLNFACLVRNVRDNQLRGLVLPDHLAIGSHDGTVRLQRAKSAGGHKVIPAGMRTKHETIEVPCLTLDTWVDRMEIDLDDLVFVKVDVQGSEVDVLHGASRVLACKHVVWQVEIDLKLLHARGWQAEDLFGILRACFTHFVDFGADVPGDRLRSIGDIREALGYLSCAGGRTDVLVFTLEQASAGRGRIPE